jgi:hypothetical protein
MNAYECGNGPVDELAGLKAEMKEWVFGIRCVLVVLNLLPLY